MNRGDITRMLLLAKFTDDRMTVDEQRVQMWWLALDRDIPADFAAKAIAAHYAGSTNSLLPAHVNMLWESERKQRSDEAHAKELKAKMLESELQAVDPREYVARIRAELEEKARGGTQRPE